MADATDMQSGNSPMRLGSRIAPLRPAGGVVSRSVCVIRAKVDPLNDCAGPLKWYTTGGSSNEPLIFSIGRDRIRFLGAMPQEQLAKYYGAADALVLASSREGWLNVLLEAMARGTPVVLTGVSGRPEIIAAQVAGVLISERSAHGLVDTLQ